MKNIKHIPKLFILAIILIPVLVGTIAFFVDTKNKSKTSQASVHDLATPTPKEDEPFGTYTSPQIHKKEFYTIVMVGDSMTDALGPHGGKMSESLNKLYKSTPGNQKIVIDNYASGSTNLLGLQEAMKQPKTISDKVYDPLLSRQFDVILIESFGYNPLSQLGTKEGLKKQTETLDELMKLLTTTHPDAMIIFVATIAPNKEKYAQEVSPGELPESRKQQVEERMEYIKNHIAYAKAHNIPLIDIYDKSLTSGDDGDLKYINPNDHIHPSFEGVDFISHEISNYIYDTQLLPR